LIISLASRDDFFVGELIRGQTAMTAEDFADWLGDQGVGHEIYSVEKRMPMDLLVESGEPTQLAKDAVSFFAGRPWDTWPHRDQASLKASLLQNENRGFFTRTFGIVVIREKRRLSNENQQSL
jgi:hypothetical protein